MWDLGCKCNC